MDFLYGTVQVGASLYVYVHHHGTQFTSLFDIVLRMHYHVVDIERFGALPGYGLEYGETKRDVGYERSVHHIQMKPIGLTAINHVDVAVEMQKICGK